MSDVVIVGGGVIGLSLAIELAEQGSAVRVIDKGEFAREASWAGAGMIPPANPEVTTLGIGGLRALSSSLWPAWSAHLKSISGIDNGFQKCGAIEPGTPDTVARLAHEHIKQGIRAEALDASALRTLEPAVNEECVAGLHLPDLAQMRTPWHGKALVAACRELGVQRHSHERVIGFESRGNKLSGVRTSLRTYAADKVCLAAGAWSQQILADLNVSLNVFPVRGQIVLLKTDQLPTYRVLLQDRRYVVPRPDGRLLVGSTEEHVGFHSTTTARVTSELIQFGRQLIPALADAEVEKTWAGLRPGSPNGVPFLGRVPTFENLFLATGHFRDGLLLSTGTARVMRQLMLGQQPAVPMSPYSVGRDQHN